MTANTDYHYFSLDNRYSLLVSPKCFSEYRHYVNWYKYSCEVCDAETHSLTTYDLDVDGLSKPLVIGDIATFVYLSDIYIRLRGRAWLLDPHFVTRAPISLQEFADKQLLAKEAKECSADVTNGLYPIQKRGLGVVLGGTKTDFTITSEEGGVFPVHSVLLSGLWPFFKTATSIDMAEKESKTLHLPHPKAWVQILVDFLYGFDIKGMDVDIATGLLGVSSMYDIPELLQLSTRYILKTRDDKYMTLDNCLYGWKRANESQAKEVQDFFAKALAKYLLQIQDSDPSKTFSDSQLVELYQQVIKYK